MGMAPDPARLPDPADRTGLLYWELSVGTRVVPRPRENSRAPAAPRLGRPGAGHVMMGGGASRRGTRPHPPREGATPVEPDEGSVTRWIGELKAGRDAAARPLWDRYFE